MKMGYHLVGKRNFGLRPLARPQGDVAGSYFRVGALATGHGAARLQVMRVLSTAAGLGATTAKATRIYVAGAHARAKIGACRAGTQLEGHDSQPQQPTVAGAQSYSHFCGRIGNITKTMLSLALCSRCLSSVA
jgi:hypothetical protein